MQFSLGQYFRRRYGHVLGELYDEKRIYVRSTDVDRTLMSAQSNLAGLYPPKGEQVWNAAIPWQPIPVHTLPLEEDNLLSNHFVCPKYTRLLQEVLAGPDMAKINEENSQLYAYLTEKTGENVTDMVHVDFVYDTLFIESLYNKTLPEWTKDVFPDKMKPLRDLSFTLTTWTPELRRLRSGVLVDNIVKTFRSVEAGAMEPEERRMLMYSGHDTTLSSHLNALDIFEPAVAPPYASAVMWELWLDADGHSHSVRVLYRNETGEGASEPHELRLPGCPAPPQRCPLDEVDRLTAHLRPADWRAECADGDAVSAAVTTASVIVCSALLVLLFSSVVVFFVAKRRRDSVPADMGYASINQHDDHA